VTVTVSVTVNNYKPVTIMSMTAQGDPMLKKRNQKTKRLEFLHREESSEEKLSTDTLSLYSNDR